MKGGILIVDGCSNLTYFFLAIGKCQQIMLKTPFNYQQKPALKKCLETACYHAAFHHIPANEIVSRKLQLHVQSDVNQHFIIVSVLVPAIF